MSTLPSRKELLVFGWIRSHRTVPYELNKVIESFSHDIVEWIVEGTKFQETFQRHKGWMGTIHSYNQKYHFSKTFKIEGIDFILEANGGYHLIQITFKVDKSKLLKTILNMEIFVNVQSNIKQFDGKEYALEYDITSPLYTNILEQSTFSINANTNIIDDYKKIEMSFFAEIGYIKYHKMKIENTLKCIMNESDLYAFNEGYMTITNDLDNWFIYIISSRRLSNSKIHRQLKIKPQTLPSDILMMKIEYRLVIMRDDKDRIEKKGNYSSMNKYGGTICEWDTSIQEASKYEIILDIKITELLICDKENELGFGDVLDEDLWSDYGFI